MDKAILGALGWLAACIVCFVVGASLANAQLLPPPPAIPAEASEHTLDEIIRLQKDCKKLLISIRDRVVLIQSQQHEQVLKQVDQQD